jgi:uncharacterized sodium:solute symporter family permease YidK
MVSEDIRKVIALVIVTLAYISIPVLLFSFAVAIYMNLHYAVQFYYTNALADALIALGLASFNVALFFGIRALIRWARE